MRNKFCFIILLFFVSIVGSAQNLKGTKMEDRIGHGADSIMTRRSYELFERFYHDGYYDEARRDSMYKFAVDPWLYVFDNAPLTSQNLYRYGANIFQYLAKNETDSIRRQYYFDLLMKVYDKRIDNLEALNSFTDDEKFLSKKGDLLTRKAYDYYTYSPNLDIEVAYKLFHQGIDDLGYATEGYVLFQFVDCYVKRYETHTDSAAYREDFINDYVKACDICDFFLKQAEEYAFTDSIASRKDSIRAAELEAKAKPILDAYGGPRQNAEWYFSQHPEAATPEFLVEYYSGLIEEHKTDAKFLAGVISLLRSIEKEDTDVFDKASEYLSACAPQGGGSSGGSGRESLLAEATRMLKEGNISGANSVFQEAVENASDATAKANAAYYACAQYYKRGSIQAARQWANNALKYKSNFGKAYLMLARCVTASAPKSYKKSEIVQFNWNRGLYYCLATDKAQRAKSVDPTCAAEANRLIASYSGMFFPRSEAFMMGKREGSVETVMGERTRLRLR